MSPDLHAGWITCAWHGQDMDRSVWEGSKKETWNSCCTFTRLGIYVVIFIPPRSTHFTLKRTLVSKEKTGRRGKTGHQSGSILDWCHPCALERWGQRFDKFPLEYSWLHSILQAIFDIFKNLIACLFINTRWPRLISTISVWISISCVIPKETRFYCWDVWRWICFESE